MEAIKQHILGIATYMSMEVDKLPTPLKYIVSLTLPQYRSAYHSNCAACIYSFCLINSQLVDNLLQKYNFDTTNDMLLFETVSNKTHELIGLLKASGHDLQNCTTFGSLEDFDDEDMRELLN